jgi:hypothetical protein
LQCQLPLNAFRRFRQCLEQPQRRTEELDCFSMGGALRRLFSGPPKVLKCLAGIAAAFIVMGQFAQMIVESLGVKCITYDLL